MRRRLPEGVRMYTGDDFNYPDLIAGDERGYSDALLGIFDPIAPAAAAALAAFAAGDRNTYDRIFAPTVPLSRLIFRAPTQHYKAGLAMLAWLSGEQDNAMLVNREDRARDDAHFARCVDLARACGALTESPLLSERLDALARGEHRR